MKLLTALFLLIALPIFGATPSYEKFIGAGGIVVTPNPPFGTVVIDGSGVVASGTNSSLQFSTNGVAVSTMASNLNLTAGTNLVLSGTNIGSTAHINYRLADNVSIPGDLVVRGPSLFLDEVSFDNVVVFNSAVAITNGATNGFVLTTDGSGNATWQPPAATGITSINENTATEQFITLGTNILDSTRSPTLSNGVNGVNFNFPYAAVTVNGILHSNDWVRFNAAVSNAVAPPWSSVQFNSNGVQRGSDRFVYTNGNVGIGQTIPAARLHVLPTTSGQNYLRLDNTDGTPLFQFGEYPSTPTDAAVYIGNVVAGANNYALSSDGSSLAINAPDASGALSLAVDAVNYWFLEAGGAFKPTADNSYDIGAFTENVRTGYVNYPRILPNAGNGKVLTSDANGVGTWQAAAGGGSGASTNQVLTNLIGTVARNVTNVVSLSTSNATSKPLTNSYSAGTLTLFGLEAGANTTITPNGSNLVIAATGGGGTPGGENFSVQWNSNGVFQGDTMLQYHPQEYHSENFGPTLDVGRLGESTNVIDPSGFTILGNGGINFRTPGPTTVRWQMVSAGHFLPGDSNTFDFGSWAMPARTGYVNWPRILPNAGNGKVLTSDANGVGTWQTPSGSGGISGIIAGRSNQIPYLDITGTNYTYGAGPLSGLTNAGFGFRPTGPNAGYGGLEVFADAPMALLTVGHPNPASDFATFATAFMVSNRFNSTADYQNDMIKFETVMIGGGLSPTSTVWRARVWQGTTSSNDVAFLDVSGLFTTTGFQLTNGAANNRNFKSDEFGVGSWGPPNAGGNGNGNVNGNGAFAPAGGVQFAYTNTIDGTMMLESTNTFWYDRTNDHLYVGNFSVENFYANSAIFTNGIPAPGNDGDIMFNRAGVMAGTNFLTYDATNHTVTLQNPTSGSIIQMQGGGISLITGGAAALGFGINGGPSLYNWQIAAPADLVRMGSWEPTGSNIFSVGSPENTVSNLFVNNVIVKQRIGINTNTPAVALHVVPMLAGPNTLTLADTNGTPRVQAGVLPTASSFGSLTLGNVVPTAINYAIASDGGSINLQGTTFSFNSGATPRWTIDAIGHLLPSTDGSKNIGTPTVRGNNLFAMSVATYRSNLVASAAINIGVSGTNWTNSVVFTSNTNNVTVYIDCSTATTVGTISKNGQQLFGSIAASGVTVNLKPNEYFTVSYTGTAPTARWEPW